MVQELSRMEKPPVERFAGARSIFLVPLIFALADPPEEYAAMYDRYWAGVQEHLAHLMARLGTPRRAYHETVWSSGDEGLKSIQAFNQKSYEVAKAIVESGAEVTAIEDEELTREAFDWQRCLLSGLASQRVARLVYASYQEATQKRYECIAQRIDASLQPGEIGVLFIGEDHWVQFPTDIQVFYVSPPALDEIHRWLRDRAHREQPTTE